MTLLVLGLLIFLGVHSTRVFAEGWRSAQLARMGEKGWKGAYAVASLAGFVMLVWAMGWRGRNPCRCGRLRSACAIWRRC